MQLLGLPEAHTWQGALNMHVQVTVRQFDDGWRQKKTQSGSMPPTRDVKEVSGHSSSPSVLVKFDHVCPSTRWELVGVEGLHLVRLADIQQTHLGIARHSEAAKGW